MNSVWSGNTVLPHFDTQVKDLKTDVLIIGGGITGILCAYFLEAADVDYLLVEANTVGSGITKNTTAKITFQHGLIYNKLIRTFGTEKAYLYLDINRRALAKYKSLCSMISCDFELKDAFVYSLNDREKIERECEAYRILGEAASFEKKLPLPFSASGAVRIQNQAEFHPLKFLSALSERLHILEHTKVREFMPGETVTDRGKIKAEKIIVTTHFPLLNKHGAYSLKLYQHRSYVLALKNAANVNGMFVDEALTGLSFRNYKDLLLIGGGSHRTGKHGGNWDELSEFARRYFPNAEETARWATQDCMTLDGMPYIGQYSKSIPNLYTATGFNKWGMTSAMAAAMILSDLVQEKRNPYAELFSPSRSVLHPQLMINALESAIGLLTPTVPRCPHLGCALKYNKDEHSWDCPCHGSRFTESGELLDNPATDDKQI